MLLWLTDLLGWRAAYLWKKRLPSVVALNWSFYCKGLFSLLTCAIDKFYFFLSSEEVDAFACWRDMVIMVWSR